VQLVRVMAERLPDALAHVIHTSQDLSTVMCATLAEIADAFIAWVRFCQESLQTGPA